MKAVLEEDGTEIDNEYLEFLDPNNAIILLEQQENWTDKDNCNLPVSEGHGKLIVMHSLSISVPFISRFCLYKGKVNTITNM